jgi:hypothetical protein
MGCCCFVLLLQMVVALVTIFFAIFHLTTLSVAEIMQGVASVMDGWLDQLMRE